MENEAGKWQRITSPWLQIHPVCITSPLPVVLSQEVTDFVSVNLSSFTPPNKMGLKVEMR